MATRRTRIKPVVNIPQGRKIEKKPKEELDTSVKPDDVKINISLNDTPSTTDHNINKEVIDIEHGSCKTTQRILESINTVKGILTSPKRVNNDVVLDAVDNLASNLTNDKPMRRSLIKPKLNKKVLEKSRDNHKSLDVKEIIDEPNTLSNSEIQIKSLETTDAMCQNLAKTCTDTEENIPLIDNIKHVGNNIRSLPFKHIEGDNCKTIQTILPDLNAITDIITSPKRADNEVTSHIVENLVTNLTNDTCISQKPTRRSLIKPKLNKNVLEKSKNTCKLSRSTINSTELLDNTNNVSSCDIQVKSKESAESNVCNTGGTTCTITEQHVFSPIKDDKDAEHTIRPVSFTTTERNSCKIPQKIVLDTNTVTGTITTPKHVHNEVTLDAVENMDINLINDTCTPQKPMRRSLIKPKLNKKVLEKSKDDHKLLKSIINGKEKLDDSNTQSSSEIQLRSLEITDATVQNPASTSTNTKQNVLLLIENVENAGHKIRDIPFKLIEHDSCGTTQKIINKPKEKSLDTAATTEGMKDVLLNDTLLSSDCNIDKEVMEQKILEDINTVKGITSSPKHVQNDIISDVVESSAADLTNDKCTIQKTSRRSFIKPKLNKKVLEKCKDSHTSPKSIINTKEILDNTNTFSSCEIQDKLLETMESTVDYPEVTCTYAEQLSCPAIKNDKNPGRNIRRLSFKPTLNPKLLNNLKQEQVVDSKSSENDTNMGCVKEEIVSSKDLTNRMAKLIKEIDHNSAETVKYSLAKPTVNQDILVDVGDVNNPGTEMKEDSQSCVVGKVKSEEEDVEIVCKQKTLDDIDQITNTPRLSITRRPLIRPVLSRKLLTKVGPKVSISTTSQLSDDNCVLDLPQQMLQDSSDQQSTSCFDIMQADIVIPGAMVKDDTDQVVNQDLVIPASYSSYSDPVHLKFVNKTTNECNINSYKNNQQIKFQLGVSESDDMNTNCNESEIELQKWYVAKNDESMLTSHIDNVIAELDIDSRMEVRMKVQDDVNMVNITDLSDLHSDFINDKSNCKVENDTSSNTKLTDTKPKPSRRIFSKSILNKKLLIQRKQEYIKNEDPKVEDTETNDVLNIARLPQEVTFDSQSDILQLSELEIASTNEQESGDSNLFVKPSVNLMVTNENGANQVFDDNYHNQREELECDSEQITPPPNPVKMMGRGRIKAVPYLGRRRVSSSLYGSASESEDDVCRKRSRTDSASSTSGIQELNDSKIFDGMEEWKDIKCAVPRKCIRSEQSRKVAEARRTFLQKFGNRVPDKQNLTMMDLIYYNPCTEPMSQKTVKVNDEKVKEEKVKEEKVKEETVKGEKVKEEEVKDETSKDSSQLEHTESFESNKENELVTDDEGDGIPAPQIKIGINGEIIIDEKSLVIENAQTRKSREQLQKSDIVDGDFDTGYGVFKRVKRTKEWTKPETIHFYKALNILGTDFTLMSEFFHNRTRRELKMKFKKEERYNLALVDKALAQQSHFDMVELRHDLEKLKLLLEPDPETSAMLKKTEEFLKLTRKKKKMRSTTVFKKQRKFSQKSEDDVKSHFRLTGEEEKKHTKPPKPKKKYKPKVNKYTKKRSELNIFKPTRSGRVPKPKHPFDSYDSLIKHTRRKTNCESDDEQNQLLPGSLMIISYPTSTGQPCFKVFMVTGDQKQVPITLTDDVLNNITKCTTVPTEDTKAEQLLAESPKMDESNVDSDNEEADVKILKNE